MTIRIGQPSLSGLRIQNEKDIKLNKYKELQEKSQQGILTPAGRQKLAALRKELQDLNIIDQYGREHNTIFNKAPNPAPSQTPSIFKSFKQE